MRPDGEPSDREDGLRHLANSNRNPLSHLQLGLQVAYSPARSARQADALRRLVGGTDESMPSGTSPERRAKALWRLVRSEIDKLELPEDQHRVALQAVLHLDPTNTVSTVDGRLEFARDRGDFGTRSSGRRHGIDALRLWWGEGVRALGHALDERIDFLASSPQKWSVYFDDAQWDDEAVVYRQPSPGAQPVFLDLFITTVFMRKRAVYRRLTERIVTAQQDGVAYYTARALPESEDVASSIPVQALWGCKALRVPSLPGEPVLTKLLFPSVLGRGKQQHFLSEAVVDGSMAEDRRSINVEVDHHGIAPGRLHGLLPVAGLTIRVVFEEGYLPDRAWWYAELTERERHTPPADGRQMLQVGPDGCLQHTFTRPCQPRENYGIAFAWQPPNQDQI